MAKYIDADKLRAEEESLGKTLDEAAHQYAWNKQEHHIDFDENEYLDYGPRYDAFKVGAKWQEEKNQEIIKLAEDHAFLAGADWQKEQMMKEVAEGEVILNPYPTICLNDCKDYDFKDGDNVRIIVLKAEESK